MPWFYHRNPRTNVINHFSVAYIEVETLRSIAEINLASRREEQQKAKKLVDEFVKEFQSIYFQRIIEKAHHAIPVHLKMIKEKALNEIYSKELAQLDDESRALLMKVIDYIEKKYIALTMASSKEAFKYKI